MTEPATKGRATTPSEPTMEEIAAAQLAEEQAATQAAIDANNSLIAAVANVAGAITEVPKNGFNDHFKYAFASKDDVIVLVKPLMAKEGLAIVPHVIDVEREGSLMTVRWHMHVLHVSGSMMVVPWASEAQDSQDKGFSKCATSAMKTFYLSLFDIPAGDAETDIEHNAGGAEPATRSSSRSSGGQVGVRELLDYKAKHEVTNVQLDWVITQPAIGATAGTKLVALPKDKLPLVLAGMERVVAERAKRDPDTGEPKTQAPAEGIPAPESTGDYTSFDPANSDDDIPF